MKKLLFLFVMLLSLNICARDIAVEKKTGSGDWEAGGRTDQIVMAAIDCQVITVSFSELTSSQIVVKDSAELTVFNQIYGSAYSAQANLTSLSSGIYTLYIYAMGYWWYGQFEIE